MSLIAVLYFFFLPRKQQQQFSSLPFRQGAALFPSITMQRDLKTSTDHFPNTSNDLKSFSLLAADKQPQGAKGKSQTPAGSKISFLLTGHVIIIGYSSAIPGYWKHFYQEESLKMSCSRKLLMGQRENRRSSKDEAGLCGAERWKRRSLGGQVWDGTTRQRFPLLKHTHQTEGQLNEDGKKGYKPETNISSARCYRHNPGRGRKCLEQWDEQQQR